MKKFFTLLFCALIAAPAAHAQADTDAAMSFAQNLADEIMADVVHAKVSLKQKQDAFHRIFISAINIKSTARFTLGRYARTATDAQMDEYAKALTDNIIFTWTERFNNYAGETIRFESARPGERGEVYVHSTLDIPNTEKDVEIIWRITKNKKDELKLADLVVEGVSMLMSYRNEYTSVLQQNGGDIPKLIETLKQRNEIIKNPAPKN